jgi:hypothetical protein
MKARTRNLNTVIITLSLTLFKLIITKKNNKTENIKIHGNIYIKTRKLKFKITEMVRK